MLFVRLSRYQREIAFLLTSLFISGGYASLKAQTQVAYSYTVPKKQASAPILVGATQPVGGVLSLSSPTVSSVAFGQEKNSIPNGKEAAPEVDGPGQPEMQSFQSVNANNLVDLFSGDFSYNIPLLDVGGYPLNLHYSSGVSMDQEASWVGLGWNVNPGTISRNMRGLPDDFNGRDSIQKTFNVKDNVTVGVTADFKPEIFGKEVRFKNLGNLNTAIMYNSYTGPSLEVGLNPTILSAKPALGDKNFGVDTLNLGMGLRFSTNGGFSANPNFMAGVKNKSASGIEGNGNIGLNFSSRKGLESLTMSFRGTKKMGLDKDNQAKNPTHFKSAITFAHSASVPHVTAKFTSFQFSFKVKPGGAIFGFHPLASVGGYFSRQFIAEADRTTKLPAYGYLHYQKAGNDPRGLMDFNRENDHPYSPKLPVIGVPVYTYDTYSITGEGTGGMFRPYRGEVGFVRDHYMKSGNVSGNLGLDFGGGGLYHGGADLSFNYTYTANKLWESENSLKNFIPFRETEGAFEAVYFRNPSEKTTNTTAFYNAVGNNDLVRVKIGDDHRLPQATGTLLRYNDQLRQGEQVALGSQARKTTRDKRQQVISYLTAKEAAVVGLDTAIQVYPYNDFVFCQRCDSVAPPIDTSICSSCRVVGLPGCDTAVKESRVNEFRKAHHLSQITVLNPDGRTYVYGVPAYNFLQREVTFAVAEGNATPSTGMVGYAPGTHNSTGNNQGKDNFFSAEQTPAYAHSFLLSGVLSPDYVDVKGDGITPDDLGDAVKFNYTKLYSQAAPFRWRTPYAQDSANYNEGFSSHNQDGKGSYVYGQKEIWYLHSIESKTMVATFTLEDRLDSKGVLGENGGRDGSQSLKRLKEINLYAKKDMERYGTSAKPIKTVHFGYSYRLCKGAENTSQDSGKLTLESVWFSYNKNNKGKENPYLFKYKENPVYQKKAYDRWGNYKLATSNPHGLSNELYPYATQDSLLAAQHIAAWTLDTIYLPAGGRMVVDYESDDYAFVQNRRAGQMFTLLGFGNTATAYSSSLYEGLNDRPYVFIDLPEPVTSVTEFYQKYLQGHSKLFFRINVKMPQDTYGGGSENVPLYAEYKEYGVTNIGGTTRAWVRLKDVDGKSPLVVAAMQFLRLNLPSKAYPGSDVQGSNAAAAMVRILFSVASSLMNNVLSFEKLCRVYNWANEVTVSKSIVRLHSPNYKKLGGGIRVKRVRLYDNWKNMGGGKEAVYGQVYDYTTLREINGKLTRISSGVATYEPMIGGEENPFRQPMEYSESSSIIGPTFGYYIDNPVGETFYPSPSVGYSKVRVSSINRDKTRSANGFSETEFYTAFDFPVKSSFTPFDRTSKRNFNSPLKYFLPDDRHYLTLTQGFKVELNDMHGKLKRQATYAESDTTKPLSFTTNIYRVANSQVEHPQLVNDVPLLTSNGTTTSGLVGKDIELMVDLREQMSETVGANVEVNADGFVIPLAFLPLFLNIPSFIPTPNHSINLYRSAAVTKVVQSYGILDSVVHFEKGSMVSVKNLLYDQETGEPVLTRTQNAFDDPVYNFNYLAHWAYEGMGPAYQNIGYVQRGLSFFEGQQPGIILSTPFVSGDEVLATGKEGTKTCYGSYTYNTTASTKKLWVIAGSKIQGQTGLYFVDREGKAYTANDVEVKIIRSGRRNMAANSIGAITTLKYPSMVQSFVGTQVRFDDTSKILSASAVRMKEDWKGDPIRTICDDTAASFPGNPFIQGMLGNWRPFRSMTYYGRRAESSPTILTDIRRNGTFADFHPFWNFPVINLPNNASPVGATGDTSRWVWNSEATLFNRKGYELENCDPLGRYNAGLYGYNNSLPVAVAQNAKYREILYEGFEDLGTDSTVTCLDSCRVLKQNGFQDPLPFTGNSSPYGMINGIQKHTGRNSLRLIYEDAYSIQVPVSSDTMAAYVPYHLSTIDNGSYYCPPKVKVSNNNTVPAFSPIQGKKIVVSYWFKLDGPCPSDWSTASNVHIRFYDSGGGDLSYTSTSAPSNSIIEGWRRIERIIDVPSNAAKMEIKFWASSSNYTYFDDLRIHPYHANMKSFVYHPTNLRLMAELDENNYATFYEYDDDGTLVRVKKETVNGIKTIKETRSALVKK
jgi:hypothetical protein